MRKLILFGFVFVLIFGVWLGAKSYRSSESVNFEELVPGEIVKIEYHNGGNGLLYETDKKSLINSFIEALKSTTYRETKPNPWTGGGSLRLYGENKKIIGLSFGPNYDVAINGVYYKMNKNINDQLQPFFNEFIINANVQK
ncbi:hypothetical protein ACFQZT_28980 [Paenibacillus sp. GCM10027628]|uniref:hypothetical protein n=1 Tax=Paenibacillus sp. GCM10027628 TaxID=3273413 RepID=UPI003637F767